MSDLVERLRTHFKGYDDKGIGSSTFDIMKEAAASIEALEAEVERWHRVAMEAGAITCSDGRHIYPRRDRIEELEAALKEAGEMWVRKDNRIEQLEAALRAIAYGEYRVVETCEKIARAALAPEQEK